MSKQKVVWEVVDRGLSARVHTWVGRILRYDGHWGEAVVPVQIIEPGATIGDIMFMATKMVEDSGDDHHIFIEDIEESSDGVFLDIVTGS